jgi:hypothetical protein
MDGYYNHRISNYQNVNIYYDDLLNRFINIANIFDYYYETLINDDDIENLIIEKIKMYYVDIMNNLDAITTSETYNISDFLSTFYTILEIKDLEYILNLDDTYREKYPLMTNGEYTYGNPKCIIFGDLTNIKYNDCSNSNNKCNLNCYNSMGGCHYFSDTKMCITNTIDLIDDYDKKLGFLISIKDYKKFDIQDLSNLKNEQFDTIFLNKIQYNLATKYETWQINKIILNEKINESTYNDYYKIILAGVFNFLNLETIYHMALNKKNNYNTFQNEPYEFLTSIFTNIQGRTDKYLSSKINPNNFNFYKYDIILKINEEEKSFIDANGIKIDIINDFDTKSTIAKEIQYIKDVFSILENEQNMKNYKKYYDLMISLSIGNDDIEISEEEKFYVNNSRNASYFIVNNDWIVHEIVLDDYLISISKKKLATLFQSKILQIFLPILTGELSIYDYPVFINIEKKSVYFQLEFLILLKLLGYEKWYCYAILE